MENFVGSVTGKGFNKEDIMRIDANTENELRDKGYGEASKKLEKIKNSTLEYSETRINDGNRGELRGRINGHNVVVNKSVHYAFMASPVSRYNGTIDGLELSEIEARKIYSEYRDVAEERTEKIISVKNKSEIEKQNILKKEKEKAEAEAKEKADIKTKEDAITKAEIDAERALLLKDLGF